jgi:hypothetical protein
MTGHCGTLEYIDVRPNILRGTRTVTTETTIVARAFDEIIIVIR